MGMTAAVAPGHSPEPMMEMNMTPLIDVMLVLIIMFIITIPIQNHMAKLNLPSGPATVPVVKPPVVDIVVDFDGTLYWNQDKVNPATLEQRLGALAAKNDATEVHLRANNLAKYKHVAAVMASAQKQGVSRIGIVGNEQFL
jgi:biopolymer transport protein ExbD